MTRAEPEERRSPMEALGWRDKELLKARKSLVQTSVQGEVGVTREPGGAIRTMVLGGAEGGRSQGRAEGPRWSDWIYSTETGDSLDWAELETGRPRQIHTIHWCQSCHRGAEGNQWILEREAGWELWKHRRLNWAVNTAKTRRSLHVYNNSLFTIHNRVIKTK